MSIVLTKYRDRILDILKNDPKIFERLNDNPVKLAFGPKPKHFPNTTEIVRGGNYISVGNLLLKNFGFRFAGASPITYRDILRGSPVSIFERRGRFCCPKESEEALKDFITEKLVRLGKLS